MSPSDLIGWFFLLFIVAPGVAAYLAAKDPARFGAIGGWSLLAAWLANAAATVACLEKAFAGPSSGIGNGVFLLVAIPFGLFAIIWFGVWRGIRRHAYVQSLAPAERGYEELIDIERAIEAATASLRSAQRKLDSWFIGSEESADLKAEIERLEHAIAHLKVERAKRRG